MQRGQCGQSIDVSVRAKHSTAGCRQVLLGMCAFISLDGIGKQ